MKLCNRHTAVCVFVCYCPILYALFRSKTKRNLLLPTSGVFFKVPKPDLCGFFQLESFLGWRSSLGSSAICGDVHIWRQSSTPWLSVLGNIPGWWGWLWANCGHCSHCCLSVHVVLVAWLNPLQICMGCSIKMMREGEAKGEACVLQCIYEMEAMSAASQARNSSSAFSFFS